MVGQRVRVRCPGWCVVDHGGGDRRHESVGTSLGVGHHENQLVFLLTQEPNSPVVMGYLGDGFTQYIEQSLECWSEIVTQVPRLIDGLLFRR